MIFEEKSRSVFIFTTEGDIFILEGNSTNATKADPSFKMFMELPSKGTFNWDSFKNYVEQQMANFSLSWTNGSYTFSYKERHLYVRKDGSNNDLKISNFEGTVIESYFSDKNNDVLFTTDKALLLIREGKIDALKVSGVTGKIGRISFYKKTWMF